MADRVLHNANIIEELGLLRLKTESYGLSVFREPDVFFPSLAGGSSIFAGDLLFADGPTSSVGGGAAIINTPPPTPSEGPSGARPENQQENHDKKTESKKCAEDINVLLQKLLAKMESTIFEDTGVAEELEKFFFSLMIVVMGLISYIFPWVVRKARYGDR